MIEDDLVEAVIGIAPNLFYGTGIPACILVLRQRISSGANRVSGKPEARQGKVLFINADREFFEGRAQNTLLPEHIEKIVTTFDEYRAIPGFSAIVDNATLRTNDYNLNIRRYADNAPPPEPQDVRAHLVGGIPKAEVSAKSRLFEAQGLNPLDLLVERNTQYYDYKQEFDSRSTLKPAIENNPGLVAKEASVLKAFDAWWVAHSVRITALAGQRDNSASLVALRNDLLGSFSQSIETLGLLDPFQVRGIIAGFWYQTKFDFLTLMARDSKGVVDAWRTSIVTALEDKASRESPLEHKLVRFLMGDFVCEINELEAKKAELESRIKAATPAQTEDGEEVAEEADDETAIDEAQLKAWKKELSDSKKQLKAKQDSFTVHLNTAVDNLTAEQAADLLLTILHHDMKAILERHISTQRKQIVAEFENWWDKYKVTLTEIEDKRDTAAKTLQGFLIGLGYV
jgi:type I restriction enzyme M protein